MKFRSQYSDDSHSFITPAGSGILPVYEFIDVDGSKCLVKTGEANIHAKIQAATPSVEMENLISRYLAGDTSALLVRQGSYGDFTKMPTTYAELYDRMNECEIFFNRLPAEIKAEYGNSMRNFWTHINEPKTALIVKKYVDDVNVKNAEFLKSIAPKSSDPVKKEGEL